MTHSYSGGGIDVKATEHWIDEDDLLLDSCSNVQRAGATVAGENFMNIPRVECSYHTFTLESFFIYSVVNETKYTKLTSQRVTVV